MGQEALKGEISEGGGDGGEGRTVERVLEKQWHGEENWSLE